MPYYSLEWTNLWMGVKETAFRTNAQGADASNVYNSVFRRFPIKWDGAIAPQPLRYLIEKRRAAGKGLDYSNAIRNGYEECVVSLTGDILDFAFLYQLCGACTTAGSYTHTYASSTTPATPTFQMLQRVKSLTTWTAGKKGYTNEAIADGNGHTTATMTTNSTIALNAFAGFIVTIDNVEYRIVSNTATAGATKVVFTLDRTITCTDTSSVLYMTETKYHLYLGCKIVDFQCGYSEASGRVKGTLTIQVANIIAGTPLTTDPAWITTTPYYFNPLTGFVWTGYTGPHTYVGYCLEWTFRFINGQFLRKANYMTLADKVLAKWRTIELEWTWASEELDDLDDSQRDPTTDLDQDLVQTLTNGTNTMVMTWVKLLIEHLGEAYDWKDFYLGRKYRASLNPSQTSTLTLVETNSADATYYEG